MGWMSLTLVIAWAVLLIGALVYPLLLPGEFALRDMVVVSTPALTPAAVGLGDGPPRNVPQDGVLALAGSVMDASILVRIFLLIGAISAAAGAAWLTHQLRSTDSAWATGAAITVAVWNPFVIERFLQGQWSLAMSAWLLPLIAAAGWAGRWGIQSAAMWLASLTPTGAIFGMIVGLSTSRGPLPTRPRIIPLTTGIVASLPWIITGFLSADGGSSHSHSAAMFAPRAEEFVGTAGALLGLGGIWNGQAVPESRRLGWALAGVVLVGVLILAARSCPRPFLMLMGMGFAIAACGWLLPDLIGAVVAHVPGGGLLRDSQKFVALAIPGYVALAGLLDTRAAVAALACALIQIPDASVAMQALTPRDVSQPQLVTIAEQAKGRDVYFDNRPPLLDRGDGTITVDPATKIMSVVESGELRVDGITVDDRSARHKAVEEAYDNGRLDELRKLNVGLVVAANGTVTDTGLEPPTNRALLVLAAAWWPLVGLSLGLSGWWRRRQ